MSLPMPPPSLGGEPVGSPRGSVGPAAPASGPRPRPDPERRGPALPGAVSPRLRLLCPAGAAPGRAPPLPGHGSADGRGVGAAAGGVPSLALPRVGRAACGAPRLAQRASMGRPERQGDMTNGRFGYTAIGLVAGTAVGILLAVLLGAWWYGLVGAVAGLVIG